MKYTIALAGNPNPENNLVQSIDRCPAHVGNWPGVTLEKEGSILRSENLNLIDLPEYILSPYTLKMSLREIIFKGEA